MKCMVTVWGRPVDIAAIYRERGFSALPPTITVSRADLVHYGAVDYDRRIVRLRGDVEVNDGEAIDVQDGDVFDAVPQARW